MFQAIFLQYATSELTLSLASLCCKWADQIAFCEFSVPFSVFHKQVSSVILISVFFASSTVSCFHPDFIPPRMPDVLSYPISCGLQVVLVFYSLSDHSAYIQEYLGSFFQYTTGLLYSKCFSNIPTMIMFRKEM